MTLPDWFKIEFGIGAALVVIAPFAYHFIDGYIMNKSGDKDFEKRDYNKAAQKYKKAKDNHRKFIKSYYNLARAYKMLGDKRAIESIEKIERNRPPLDFIFVWFKLFPKSHTILKLKAEIHEDFMEYEKAAEAYRLAIENTSDEKKIVQYEKKRRECLKNFYKDKLATETF